MGNVSDTYEDVQATNTSIDNSGVTQWSPVPSSRFLFSIGMGDTSAIPVAGVLLLGSGSGFGGVCFYNYLGNGGSPQDFSGLLAIFMIAIPEGAVTDITLTLGDGTNSSTVNATPVTDSWTWLLSSFVGVDLTAVQSAVFQSDTAATGTNQIDLLGSLLLCVARDTMVLMADGKEKMIQDIERGDMVRANCQDLQCFRVARVPTMIVDARAGLDIVRMDSCPQIGLKRPLLITGNHPIIYAAARRPAKCFVKLPGVTYHTRKEYITPRDILPVEPNGSYKLYDLQFETDGSYVANGVCVQSRCPRSDLTPLPKHLYFDESLWTPDVVWDVVESPYPLCIEMVEGQKMGEVDEEKAEENLEQEQISEL